MYERMMYQIVERSGRNVKHCSQVLLIMANSYRPLRLSELAVLAEIPRLVSIGSIIRLCGMFSLRANNQFVYFIHQSAKEYLVTAMSPKLSSEILPNGTKEGDKFIVTRSLNAMSDRLRRDIYNLKRPDIHLEEINPPPIDPLVSIRYCCVYWIDHLLQMISKIVSEKAHDAFDIINAVETFWEKSSIYWIEALILKNDLAAGMSAIAKMLDFLKVC
jgi:hypothetical protein